METFIVDWLPGKRVIQGKTLATFEVRRDLKEAARLLNDLLDQAVEPVPYVLDLIELKIDFSGMIFAMADLTHGEGAVWRHPKLRELVVITGSSMVRFGVNSLRQMQYGNLKTAAFMTLEEAYQYVGHDLTANTLAKAA